MYLYDPATQSYYPNVIVDGSSNGQIISGTENGDEYLLQEKKGGELKFT